MSRMFLLGDRLILRRYVDDLTVDKDKSVEEGRAGMHSYGALRLVKRLIDDLAAKRKMKLRFYLVAHEAQEDILRALTILLTENRGKVTTQVKESVQAFANTLTRQPRYKTTVLAGQRKVLMIHKIGQDTLQWTLADFLAGQFKRRW